MVHRKRITILTLVLAFVLFFIGCSTFEGLQIREEDVEAYRQSLAEKTEIILADNQSFGLEDCIQIALQNNLTIRAAEIQARISKLERKVAFSRFLPTVNINYNYTRWDSQPKIRFGADAVAMHDQRIRDITWQIQTSIFDPSTWFIYSMHQRGEEIAELVTEYTMQIMVLRVTVMYFHCLTLQEVEKALESQLAAAAALEKEVQAFYEEGLASQWQVKQAQVLVLGRRTGLHRTENALSQAKADLLTAMGLSPFADISLSIETPLKAPEEALEVLVTEALLSHPQLKIADRDIAIEKEKVKVAIAGFLPRLVGFANRTHSSDSFMVYPNYWTYGLMGTVSLFNGFANINEYKAAKERQKEAFIQREEASATLMLEVVKAYLNLENAREEMALANKSFDMVSAHFAEVEQQWQEGLVNYSELVSTLAKKDEAQMSVMGARFQFQVSTATLFNVMGKTDIESREQKHED